jgi:hypothetical protein
LAPSITERLRAESNKLAAITISEDEDSTTKESIRRAIDHSFVAGFRTVMLIGAGLALASSIVALIYGRSSERRRGD